MSGCFARRDSGLSLSATHEEEHAVLTPDTSNLSSESESIRFTRDFVDAANGCG